MKRSETGSQLDREESHFDCVCLHSGCQWSLAFGSFRAAKVELAS